MTTPPQWQSIITGFKPLIPAVTGSDVGDDATRRLILAAEQGGLGMLNSLFSLHVIYQEMRRRWFSPNAAGKPQFCVLPLHLHSSPKQLQTVSWQCKLFLTVNINRRIYDVDFLETFQIFQTLHRKLVCLSLLFLFQSVLKILVQKVMEFSFAPPHLFLHEMLKQYQETFVIVKAVPRNICYRPWQFLNAMHVLSS